MVLTWDAKVIAAADIDAAVEMNRKHKVTPDWGDLIICFEIDWIIYTYLRFGAGLANHCQQKAPWDNTLSISLDHFILG